MKLPLQAPPVTRDPRLASGKASPGGAGVTASQSACDNLTGLAQQMCLNLIYGAGA
jgi:hypothetical protein